MREAINNRDRDAVASTLATSVECTIIGSAPEEWLTGDQVRSGLDAAMTAEASSVRVEMDDTFVHVRGDVAWIEGRGRFVDPAGRERAFRMTGVDIKEEAGWKGVQSHVSIGVPNDQIFA
jgi:ketosteroid isomerase-like protein